MAADLRFITPDDVETQVFDPGGSNRFIQESAAHSTVNATRDFTVPGAALPAR